MKIALIGYGKMGKEIEFLALKDHHEVVLKINAENRQELTRENLQRADVAIEFTRPETAYEHICFCLDAGIPVLTGTTGWYEQLPEVRQKCKQLNGSFLFASNFSIGVQVFFMINEKLAQIMNKLPGYDISLEEIHHLEKLDAPSGTALTLTKSILSAIDRKTGWKKAEFGNTSSKEIVEIRSVREDKVVGTHIVNYESDADKITIQHEAKNRQGFASGALMAALWLKDKKGFYGMDDFIREKLL